jgi:predicted TIM-barrel fold metal-dependent hydrolase
MAMTLVTSDYKGMAVAEFDTTKLLSHASQQARERNYEKYFIVDVDSHHYETESLAEILEYIEDPVIRHQAQSSGQKNTGTTSVLPSIMGTQDMAGRVTRYPLRKIETIPDGAQRDSTLATRWMDAMGTDIAMLFPTPILLLSTHPHLETQTLLARAYNRWLVERVLAVEPRINAMLYLPMHDPDACYKMILEFGDKKGVKGFMVTAPHSIAVHDNAYMKIYKELEERGLPLAFHAATHWESKPFTSMNRFISVHAIGFVFYNMIHMTNWIINAMPERFPKLKVLWLESGLAWLPFMMQRLDNEYMMRSNECPSLKRRPREYMREMYYSCQPMEIPEDLSELEQTFKMIKADTQLMFSSDYPHWDFDLPSVIYDLPFLSDQARKNILGETARNVFNISKDLGKLAKIPSA